MRRFGWWINPAMSVSAAPCQAQAGESIYAGGAGADYPGGGSANAAGQAPPAWPMNPRISSS